jgi:hypothetical protein
MLRDHRPRGLARPIHIHLFAGDRKMPWTREQSAALKGEYARIGYRPGEHWPAPSQQHTPDELLALLRSVRTGAGLQGYLDVLRPRSG